MLDNAKKLFPVVKYAYSSVPTYPSGQIGYILCFKDEQQGCDNKPKRTFEAQFERANLKYYNRDVHSAAFVLPTFTRLALE